MLQIVKIGDQYSGALYEIPPYTAELEDTVLGVLEALVAQVNLHNEIIKGFEYTAYLSYHEYDINKEHPTLVVQGDMSSYGYSVNLLTGEVDMVCLCAAINGSECICEYENN